MSIRTRAVVGNALLDLLLIAAFAAIGRRSHDEGTSVVGVLDIAWPFAVAAAISWIAGGVWRAPGSVRSGCIVWVGTVGFGMLLRHVVSGRGTALAFVIVATLFLGAVLVGRRVVATAVGRRRHRFVGDTLD